MGCPGLTLLELLASNAFILQRRKLGVKRRVWRRPCGRAARIREASQSPEWAANQPVTSGSLVISRSQLGMIPHLGLASCLPHEVQGRPPGRAGPGECPLDGDGATVLGQVYAAWRSDPKADCNSSILLRAAHCLESRSTEAKPNQRSGEVQPGLHLTWFPDPQSPGGSQQSGQQEAGLPT